MNLKTFLFFLLLTTAPTLKGQVNYNNPKDTTIVLLFKSGKYELDDISKKNVETCFKKLITNDQIFFYIINISGYSDDKGKDSTNFILSKKRALEVGKYLTSLSNDSVIQKVGTYDYMTQCNGVKYETTKYKVPIQYEYFGERELKYKKIDSLTIAKERKVLLNFKDNRSACLGTFSVCNLPTENKTFARDSSIQVFLPAGYLDQYVTGHTLPPCKYDSATKLTIKFLDSLPNKDNLCERIISSFKTKQKKPEIKIGSLSFAVFLNDTLIPNPVCKTNFYEEHKIKIRFSVKLIASKDFVLYTDKQQLIEHHLEDGFVEMYINLNATQRIDVFIKNSPFKSSKLIIKGSIDFSVSTKDPLNQCEIPFEKTGAKRNLFVKRTTYSLIKFSKTENLINFLNPNTSQSFSVNLKTLKYKKNKDTYVLNRRAIKKLTAMK